MWCLLSWFEHGIILVAPDTSPPVAPSSNTSTQTRTLYRTQYGPMLEISAAGVPVLIHPDADAHST